MKKITFLILTLATTLALHAQVAINTDNSSPDGSAMLDVKSTSTGMLVPRMTTTQRASISSPANGLLVYDITTNSFWYYQNGIWTELRAGNITSLSDADGDTKVEVEKTTDEDKVRFYSQGINSFTIDSMRIEPLKNSLFIGKGTGGLFTNKENVALGDSSLSNNGIGAIENYHSTINTAVGIKTLLYNTKGWGNTATGYYALMFNADGYNNSATGAFALINNHSGFQNTAMGYEALYSNNYGYNNTASGNHALVNNTEGNNNTATGDGALFSNTTGNGNTASGQLALSSNKTGNSNIAIGIAALLSDTSSSNLVAVGDSALYNNTGEANLAVGSKALFSNTTGSNNIAIGTKSLFSATENNYNIAIGNYTLKNLLFNTNENECGNSNIAIGNNAMLSSQKGSYSVVVGHNALRSNVQSWQNTAIGEGALYSSTGSNNTAVGSDVFTQLQNGNFNVGVGCYGDIPSSDQGGTENFTGNSILGANIGINLSTGGNYNTLIGLSAGVSINYGHSNVAIGAAALFSNTTRSNLVAVGDSALYHNGEGATSDWEAIENTAIGSKALFSNTTGNENTASGTGALYFNTTGDQNTAYGYQALYQIIDGDSNTAVGGSALFNLVHGNSNTVIGSMGYPSGTSTYSNYTGIGYYVGTSVANPSNRVEIGNTSVNWIGGQKTWSTYSDERIKDKVRADVPGLAFIMKLNPVTYNLNIHLQNKMLYGEKADKMNNWKGKYDIEQQRMTGFLAQDVAAAAKALNYEFSGVDIPKNNKDLYSLSYAEFVVPLVKGMQEQQAIIEKQNKEIDKLKQEVSKMKTIEQRLENLEKQIANK